MEEQEKQGWFDRLFTSFSKDPKVTGLVLLTFACAVFIRLWISAVNSRDDLKTEMFERVIAEGNRRVDEKVKQKTDSIKHDSEQRGAKIDTLLTEIDANNKNLHKLIEDKK